jgi:hypothetical protein
VATFQPPDCSGGDSFDLAAVGLSSARFVRIEASQLKPGSGGTAGFDLDAVAAVHFATEAPATSTTTTIVPDATATTSTTIPTTPRGGATTPALCAGGDLEGVQCALMDLAPAVQCAGEPIDPRPARTVERELARTRTLVGRAVRALARGKPRVGHRALRVADHRLQAVLTVLTRSQTTPPKHATSATSEACRQRLQDGIASALAAILRLQS